MPHHILLVDDDSLIQSMCAAALQEAGFGISAGSCVADAVKLFNLKKPDLMILDIGLPDGSGFDVCRRLGLKPPSALPFIFMTIKGDIKTRLEGFQLGAHDYIQKPFAVEELLARVRVHLHLKQERDNLARRNYDLELRERLRQDLTDMILHDLRTPLTSIKGSLDIIVNRGLISADEFSTFARQAERAADFMLLMINDLLDVSQAEQIGLRPEPADVDLASMFKKLSDLFEARAKKRGVVLRVLYSGRPQVIRTDPGLIFRILVNLISNALDVSLSGQQIELDCELRARQIRFVLSDRGPGVPDPLKGRIFEKYGSFSDHPKAASGQKRGIGLTFCRLASQSLSGRIWVEDRPGGGSLFICEIPSRIGEPLQATL